MARRSSKKMHFALKIIHSLLPVAFQLPREPAWTIVFFPAGTLLFAKWPSAGHIPHPLQILTAQPQSPWLIGKMAVSNVLSADGISEPVLLAVIWQYLSRLMIGSGDILFSITVESPSKIIHLLVGIYCRVHKGVFALCTVLFMGEDYTFHLNQVN